MTILKTQKEINSLKESGRRLAMVVRKVSEMVKPGISTLELDQYAESLIVEMGDKPAFKGYKPEGAREAYPFTLCTSVNDEVVHGIPLKDQILKEGDIISIDCGILHDGFYTDHAITVPVGKIKKEAQELIDATRQSLYFAIESIGPHSCVGDIGYAISKLIKPYGYGIIRELSGHGVGKKIHDDPYVPNYGKKGTGPKLIPGMVIAIEPMINLGKRDIADTYDGYTIVTRDGSLSCHFEHTVIITETGAEIVTKE